MKPEPRIRVPANVFFGRGGESLPVKTATVNVTPPQFKTGARTPRDALSPVFTRPGAKSAITFVKFLLFWPAH